MPLFWCQKVCHSQNLFSCFHVCFRVVSLRLVNTGANGSFWNWILSDAFLSLVPGLCLPYSYFPLFQTCTTQLAKQFVWPAHWLRSSTYLLSSSWQVISRTPVLEGNGKDCCCYIFSEEGWYQTNVCMLPSFCARARKQKCAYTWTVSRRDTVIDYNWT